MSMLASRPLFTDRRTVSDADHRKDTTARN